MSSERGLGRYDESYLEHIAPYFRKYPEMKEFRKIEKEKCFEFTIWKTPTGYMWSWFQEYFNAKTLTTELVDYNGQCYHKWIGMYDAILELEIVILYPSCKKKYGEDIEILVQFNGKVDEDEAIPWKHSHTGLFVERIYPLLMSWMSGEF